MLTLLVKMNTLSIKHNFYCRKLEKTIIKHGFFK